MDLLDLSGTPWEHVTSEDLKAALLTDDPAWAMAVGALSREEGILLVLAFGGRRLFLQAPERLAFGRLTISGQQVADLLSLSAWCRMCKAVGSSTYVYVPAPSSVLAATARRLLRQGAPAWKVALQTGVSARQATASYWRAMRALARTAAIEAEVSEAAEG